LITSMSSFMVMMQALNIIVVAIVLIFMPKLVIFPGRL